MKIFGHAVMGMEAAVAGVINAAQAREAFRRFVDSQGVLAEDDPL